MDGVLNVDKPGGITSHDVVVAVRKLLHAKKVGHTGTLDPQASGVLPLCIGKATKIVQFLMNVDKEYEATMVLGVMTTTQDAGGDTTGTREVNVTPEEVVTVFRKFKGEIEQVPPMVSAIHHRGKRLYQLARAGEEVERVPRKVFIFDLEVISCQLPEIHFRVTCSKGTYIRTLCADIGEALGCGAHQSKLVRTRSGGFQLADALSLEGLTTEKALDSLVSINEVLADLPLVTIKERSTIPLSHHALIYTYDLLDYPPTLDEGTLVRVQKSGALLGVARIALATNQIQESRGRRVALQMERLLW